MPEPIKKTPPVPAITPAHVEYFNAIFPDRCPESDFSDREVWMAAGRAQVVRKMRRMMDDQAERGLRGDPDNDGA